VGEWCFGAQCTEARFKKQAGVSDFRNPSFFVFLNIFPHLHRCPLPDEIANYDVVVNQFAIREAFHPLPTFMEIARVQSQ